MQGGSTSLLREPTFKSDHPGCPHTSWLSCPRTTRHAQQCFAQTPSAARVPAGVCSKFGRTQPLQRLRSADHGACNARNRRSSDECQMQSMQVTSSAALLQAASPWAADAKDLAQQTIETLGGGQEVISQAPKGQLTPLGLITVFLPVILYGVFNVIRSQFNPRLKLSDFYFIAAGGFIAINILSIIVFKVRFF